MGQAAGVMDEMLSWPINRAVPTSTSDESGSLAGCHLPNLETQLGTSSSKVSQSPDSRSTRLSGLGTLPLPPPRQACCLWRHKTNTLPPPRLAASPASLNSSALISAAAIPTIQWLPTAVRLPPFQNPQDLAQPAGLLVGLMTLRSLSTARLRRAKSSCLRPNANSSPRGRQKKPSPSASQKTLWYISSRINTLLSTSRLSRITSFDHTYVPILASKPAPAASPRAPTARAPHELQPANTSMGGSGTGLQVYYQYGWRRTW